MRDSEGYKNTWYDKENDFANQWTSYSFTTNRRIESDLYFSVSTYSNGIVPNQCTTTTINDGYQQYLTEVPVYWIQIFLGW